MNLELSMIPPKSKANTKTSNTLPELFRSRLEQDENGEYSPSEVESKIAELEKKGYRFLSLDIWASADELEATQITVEAAVAFARDAGRRVPWGKQVDVLCKKDTPQEYTTSRIRVKDGGVLGKRK